MYNLNMLERILIVDDTKSWIIFHKELITQLYGDVFEITTASSAAEAINIIRHNTEKPFRVIISDLQMEEIYEPLLAGEWLVENIKLIPEYAYTHIILISAMYNAEYIANRLKVECIPKTLLIRNKLLMKFMFEKLMPFLNNVN